MEKTIVTAMMIIASMIMAVMLFNVAYPAVQQGSDAVASMANGVADKMRVGISVVHASAELDANGVFQDTNNNYPTFDVFAWVKNTGLTRIIALDQIDVFFGPEGNYARIPRQTNPAQSPAWTWSIPGVPGATDWSPTATLQIDIAYSAPLAPGRYYMKVVLPDGVSSDYFLGI